MLLNYWLLWNMYVYMTFTQKNKPELQINLKVKQEEFTKSIEILYMGNGLEDELAWEKHIKKILNLVAKTTEALKR